MKKGINIWTFDDKLSTAECMKLAKKAGFHGIELALSETGEINLQSTKQDIKKIKETAKNIDIELPSLATGLFWKYSLTSGEKLLREKAKDIVKKQLEIASVLGADSILVVPGAVGVDFIKNCEIVSYDKAYDYSLEALTELKKYAEDYKISIGIENVWNKFLLSPLEMRSFIDEIDSSFVSAYLDVGNVLYSGYPEQWVKILGKRIKKVHFKDFKRSVGNINGFADLLCGDVNYLEVVKALKEIGYDDYVTGELSPNKDFPEQIIYNTSSAIDTILK